MTAVLEVTLSWLFSNAKGRDAKSFQMRPALEEGGHREAAKVTVTSPVGPSEAVLTTEYTADGPGRFPPLRWEVSPELADKVREWLLVCEDPDAPLPTPVAHGILAGIPASKTGIDHEDLEIEDNSKRLLKGGFHYGKTLRGVPYVPPRPLMNHGPHRYFYQVVALGEPLDPQLLSSFATRDQVADAIKGKVLGFGMWVGVAERKWK